MELRHYLWLFRRYILLIVVTTAVGAAVGYATTSTSKLYSSTASVYVGPSDLTRPSSTYGVTGIDQIVATYAEMIPSGVVGQAAVALTHVPRTAGQAAAETHASVVMASATTATDLITVTVTDPVPGIAERLANGMAVAFTRQIARRVATGAGPLPFEPAAVFEYAGYPGAPLPAHHGKRIGLGAGAGLVLAVLAVLLVDYLDDSVRGPGDVEDALGIPVLGVVPRLRRSPAGAEAGRSG